MASLAKTSAHARRAGVPVPPRLSIDAPAGARLELMHALFAEGAIERVLPAGLVPHIRSIDNCL